MSVTKRSPQWCKGWVDGFLAAAFLWTGRRSEYEKLRDEYLIRKGWTPPEGRAK